MSWSVNEFVATSVEVAKREIDKQVICPEPERSQVVKTLHGILDFIGKYETSNLKVRAYGHHSGGAGGNFFVQVDPVPKPLE